MAADAQGRVPVVKAGEETPVVFSRQSKLRAVAVHPTSPLLAFSEDTIGRIVITGLDGSDLLTINPPQFVEIMPQWVVRGFGDCSFSASGMYLWCASALAEDGVEVQIRDCATWQIHASIEIEDPFGGSSASFHATPDPDTFALWLAAGQDGQQICWLTRSSTGITCVVDSSLENTMPPVFSPDGQEFLTVVEDTLCRYTFPNVRPLGKCVWENEEDSFGGSVCYLNNGFALTNSGNGRLFLLNVATMTIEEEVYIEDHEPVPTEQMYPTLKGDVSLCSDMGSFERFGNVVVTVHRRNPAKLQEWKDTLLYFPVDGISRAASPYLLTAAEKSHRAMEFSAIASADRTAEEIDTGIEASRAEWDGVEAHFKAARG